MKAGDDRAGQEARCPACGRRFRFPPLGPTLPPKPPPADPLEGFDELLRQERPAANARPPDPRPIFPPDLYHALMDRLSRDREHVEITKVTLSFWNMMTLVLGFWLAGIFVGVFLAVLAFIAISVLGVGLRPE